MNVSLCFCISDLDAVDAVTKQDILTKVVQLRLYSLISTFAELSTTPLSMRLEAPLLMAVSWHCSSLLSYFISLLGRFVMATTLRLRCCYKFWPLKKISRPLIIRMNVH